MLESCIKNNISAEFRIAKSSKVAFENQAEQLKNIRKLQPKGKQAFRTIKVTWHKMKLYITAQKRISKKGKETIVYQVSTYFAKLSKYVQKRWGIEKMFRTTKQYLGLQECQSRKMETQLNHIAAIFSAHC